MIYGGAGSERGVGKGRFMLLVKGPVDQSRGVRTRVPTYIITRLRRGVREEDSMLLWDHFVLCNPLLLLFLKPAATLFPIQVLLGHADFVCGWVKGAEGRHKMLFA